MLQLVQYCTSMIRKARVSGALTVDAHAALQQISASNRDGEEGCPVQEENERVNPSPSVVNCTPVDEVNGVCEREFADDRDTGDESGDDACVFHKGDERDYEFDRKFGDDDPPLVVTQQGVLVQGL